MEKEIGKEFDSIVVGASKFAYYVRIPNGVEGAVFLGKRADEGTFPEFGTPVRVKLVRVERAYGRIDFEPVRMKHAPKIQDPAKRPKGFGKKRRQPRSK